MLNDCPTCKWCIGQKDNIELSGASGKRVPSCECSCPKVVQNAVTVYPAVEVCGSTIVNVKYCYMGSNIHEVGEIDCEYTPKDCKESDCKQCATSCKNNQGRTTCYKCNTPTVKVSTGMFTVYDVCPKCKI